MALVDPNIAMGYRGIELPNQLAQYGQIAQIQNAQNQNRLADAQMQEYERTRAEEEGLRNYLSQSDLSDPAARQGLMKFGKTGLAYGKALSEQDTAALTQQETRGKIGEISARTKNSEFDLQNKQLDKALLRIGSAPTPQHAIDFLVQDVKDGIVPMQQATAKIQELQKMQPADFAKFRVDHLLQTLSAKDQLEQSKTTTKDTDLGSFIQRQNYNAQGQAIGTPERLNKTPTVSDVTAQGNLSLAQQKFKFEQDNPGFEYKENDDGTVVAINKRTNQAFPVTVGGAAAPAPAVNNALSPRVAPAAPAVSQTIPGMPSVLDQRAPVAPVAATVPAAPVAGTPLRGKGTAMNNEQSNAALFGGAMTQAQSVIKDVASRGTYKSAVVPGLLEGLVKLAPFGVGDAAANAVESTFRSDPTGWVGPNQDQQKLAQAQIAFATAYLRKTSGAAFGPQEVANTIKEFFPLRGEPDAVIQQKDAARDRVIEGISLGTNKEGRAHIGKYASGATNPQFPGFSIVKP
jgi:hypothetical protein